MTYSMTNPMIYWLFPLPVIELVVFFLYCIVTAWQTRKMQPSRQHNLNWKGRKVAARRSRDYTLWGGAKHNTTHSICIYSAQLSRYLTAFQSAFVVFYFVFWGGLFLFYFLFFVFFRIFSYFFFRIFFVFFDYFSIIFFCFSYFSIFRWFFFCFSYHHRHKMP